MEKEIQKQVAKLMEKFLVRENMSPCAMPIILVPKKYGTWRMCSDCRAINNITIKYRHPIPRLDDLLDELHGSITLFANLDKCVFCTKKVTFQFVQRLHDKARLHMEKKGEKYAKNANKWRKKVFYKEEDLVWAHLRKEQFPHLRKSSQAQPATGSPGREPFSQVEDSADTVKSTIRKLGPGGAPHQQHKSHLGASSSATSSPGVVCNASHNKGRIGILLCRLGTKKPKVTRGDRLEHQRTLANLILSVLASRGEPSPSVTAIVVNGGATEARALDEPLAIAIRTLKTDMDGELTCGHRNGLGLVETNMNISETERVRLCSVCLHLAETKPDCLYQDHLGSVSTKSDSGGAESSTTEKKIHYQIGVVAGDTSSFVFSCAKSSTDPLYTFDPEIELTLRRLRKIRNTTVNISSSINSVINSDQSCTDHSVASTNIFSEPGQMENHDRTLKELATPDVVYQPWCIQYPQLEPAQTYELKSGLIHLLPKFHGLAGEDPHKHLKEFHVVCSTMRPQGIPEDYIKMKAFPFSLDGAAKDWLYLQPALFNTWGDMK
ncbi:hypothetical protein CR513_33189, partial [Mucuna pruriens]